MDYKKPPLSSSKPLEADRIAATAGCMWWAAKECVDSSFEEGDVCGFVFSPNYSLFSFTHSMNSY